MKNSMNSISPAWRKSIDRLFEGVCILAAGAAVVVLAILVASIMLKGWKHFGWNFVSSIASPDPEKSGVLPPLAGSVITCLICMLAAIPLGVGTAVLLEEFKPKNRILERLHALAGLNITNLAGVPSIVYGILGVTVFATAFNLFDGSETAPPAIGVQWFDQYTLPDKSAVFVKADGPAPQTPEARARAVIQETRRFAAAAQAAPQQSKEALPLYARALTVLATLPETQKALAHDPFPLHAKRDNRDLAAALAQPVELPAETLADPDGLVRALALLGPRMNDLAATRQALRDRCEPLEAEAATAADAESRKRLDAQSARLRRILGALQDDTQAALTLALGAHPLRPMLTPTQSRHWLGGDIGYQGAKAAAPTFTNADEEKANNHRQDKLDALGAALKDAVDATRAGERHTGAVVLPAPAAAAMAKTLLENQEITSPEAQKTLAGALADLDGTKSLALIRGRGATLDAVRGVLEKTGGNGAANRLAIGAPAVRVNRTLWYHIALPFGRGVLAGGLTLMLVVLPVVIVASQEALRAVPQTLRQAALGLGATPLQTVTHTVLPAATPGICTGVILALSRAIGEAAPILILGGVVYITFLPSNLMDSFTVMPLQIFSWASEPQAAFHEIAATGILILLTVLLVFNGIAVFIRQKTSK